MENLLIQQLFKLFNNLPDGNLQKDFNYETKNLPVFPEGFTR